MLLTVVADAFDAASDGSFTVIVLSEFLRIGKHGFKELQRYYLDCLHASAIGFRSRIFDFVNATHANVLYYVKVS